MSFEVPENNGEIHFDAALQNPAQVAENFARAGFKIFPCNPKTKAPLTTNGFKDATAELEAVAAFWKMHPDALVGLPTGAANGLFVIDLDVDKVTGEATGEASLMALGLAHLLGGAPTVRTPSGGLHLYFRDCGFGNSCGKLGRSIDTRGNGGYVIAPGSVTQRGKYMLKPGSNLTVDGLTSVPEAVLVRLCGNPARIPATASPKIGVGAVSFRDMTVSKAEVDDVLSHIDPDCGYDEWVIVLMGLHDLFGGNGVGFALADGWSARGTKYRDGVVASKWQGFKAGGGAGWASVCQIAKQYGAPLSEIARRHRSAENAPPTVARKQVSMHDGDTRGAINDGPRQMIVGRTGHPKWCAENACIMLETEHSWRGVLAYDEFAGLTLLLKPIPGTTVPRKTFSPRPLTDNDITQAVRWFNRNGFPDAAKNIAADALYAVAAQSVISPVRDYLECLVWDGVSRVGDWLVRYCGADDTILTRKVGEAWVISAVARAVQPGCKADCVLVLEGKQGQGKSSVFRALAGEPWFYDGLHDLHSKDASAALRGKWIIELPELSAMRRSEAEAVKAFLSRTEERYRPAYGRTEVIEPRRCVFAGTTNRNDYMTDDTGGRRFWPVAVGEVHLSEIMRDRDQIWAEAIALFRAGKKWWLDYEWEVEAAAVVADRAPDDPWSGEVLSIVDGLKEASTRDILFGLDIAKERRTRAESMRIGQILTRAGWISSGKFTSGPNRGSTRYLPPGCGL